MIHYGYEEREGVEPSLRKTNVKVKYTTDSASADKCDVKQLFSRKISMEQISLMTDGAVFCVLLPKLGEP